MEEKYQEISLQLNQINDSIDAQYHIASEKMGLADSEMTVLYYLTAHGQIPSQSEIIRATGLSKQTLNSAITRLEKEGIVCRLEKEKQSKGLALTQQGKKTVKEVLLPFMKKESEIFSSWSQEELSLFLELNRRYLESLKQIVKDLPSKSLGKESKNE